MNHGVTIHGKLLLTILKKKKQIFYARRNYTLGFAEISQKAKEKIQIWTQVLLWLMWKEAAKWGWTD